MLQRASTWVILCLSFYLTSCRNDLQINPTNSDPTSQLSDEVKDIKAWFEANAQVSSASPNCNSNRRFLPRWDKSKENDDRFEFETWVNQPNKILLPQMSGAGLKLGRTKFISKKVNGNGNGNNRQGIIASYIPFQSFTGDITQISTTTFRSLKFNGIISFEDVNGCLENAYLINNGVVMYKLNLKSTNELNGRCGETYTYTQSYYTMVSSALGGCTISYAGSSTSMSFGTPCTSGSYDSGMSSASNTGGGGAIDPIYSNYLANPQIIAVLCPSSVANGLVKKGILADNWPTGTVSPCFQSTPSQTIRVQLLGCSYDGLIVQGLNQLKYDYISIDIYVLPRAGLTESNIQGTSNFIGTMVADSYRQARNYSFINEPNISKENFLNKWIQYFNDQRDINKNKQPYCININGFDEKKGEKPTEVAGSLYNVSTVCN